MLKRRACPPLNYTKIPDCKINMLNGLVWSVSFTTWQQHICRFVTMPRTIYNPSYSQHVSNLHRNYHTRFVHTFKKPNVDFGQHVTNNERTNEWMNLVFMYFTSCCAFSSASEFIILFLYLQNKICNYKRQSRCFTLGSGHAFQMTNTIFQKFMPKIGCLCLLGPLYLYYLFLHPVVSLRSHSRILIEDSAGPLKQPIKLQGSTGATKNLPNRTQEKNIYTKDCLFF